MKNILLTIGFFFFLSINSQATTYQIDTLSQLYAHQYLPGDTVQLKRGNVYYLQYPNFWTLNNVHGTAQEPITIEAYGEGAPPVIQAIDIIPDPWVYQGNNLWQVYVNGGIYRCWIDGKESPPASSLNNVDGDTYLWNFSGGVLTIYSQEDPNNLTVEIARINYALEIKNSSWITIKDLHFEGGRYASIHLFNGNNYIFIKNNIIRRPGDNGIQANVESGHSYINENIAIENNFIDGMTNVINPVLLYGERTSEDGINIRDSANVWMIRNNVIKNFNHSCVHLIGDNQGEHGVKNIFVRDNILSGGTSHYLRGFDIAGLDGKAEYNTFYRNVIKNCNVSAQISGNNNVVEENSFLNTEICPITLHPNTDRTNISEGIILVGWKSGSKEYVSHDNYINKNVFFSSYNESIALVSTYPYGNIISNNVLLDYGLGGDHQGVDIYVAPEVPAGNIFQGNESF